MHRIKFVSGDRVKIGDSKKVIPKLRGMCGTLIGRHGAEEKLTWVVRIEGVGSFYFKEKLLTYVGKSPPKGSEPANNDGRLLCFWCNSKTQRIMGACFPMDVCTQCNR